MKKLIVFLLILLLMFGGVYVFFFRNGESDDTSTLYTDNRLIYEGDLQDESYLKVIDGQVYIALNFIKEKIDETVFYDSNEQTVVFTNDKSVRRYKLNELTGTSNDVEISLRAPLTEIDGEVMVPIEAFVYDYPIDLKYNSEEKVVTIDRTDREYMTAKVTVNTSYLREESSSKSPIVKIMSKDDQVYVYGETAEWYKVRQLEGKTGYMRKRHLELSYDLKEFSRAKDPVETAKEERKEKINLLWDYTSIKTPNGDSVENLVGVNVLSPTWFSLNEDFSIDDRSNLEYVKKAQGYGMEIWPMFDNSFKEGLTELALKSTSRRQEIIADVFKKCQALGVDGINIDFEHINVETRDNFSQFVRELYPIFSEAGMTVSVDVIPRTFSEIEKEPYDRKALAETADYIMLMAYDQHWSSSQTAGSVAEYSWVEANTNVLFRSIPMEKFVLCLPLYTRIWFDKGGKVTSQSVSMEVANEFISNNNIEMEWDSKAKQKVGHKQIGDSLVSIWLEDGQSIKAKSSLVEKYGLAGVASWRKGFETLDIWSIIDESI